MTDTLRYARETNSILDFEDALAPRADAPTLYWTEVAAITRLRLVTDPGFPVWDVSYCWGLTRDNTPCRVQLPFGQLGKGKGADGKSKMYQELIQHARRDGLHLKRLGLFDAISKCW